MAVTYVEINDCKERCFPYIRKHLDSESVPSYEKDIDGMNSLKTVLELIKNDNYYPSFVEKAAYLFCSISQKHAFDNGNKRLAATLLRYFLADNKVKTIDATVVQWKAVVKFLFPSYQWQEIDIDDAFYALLYNLAFITADSQLRPGINFEQCKILLTQLFERIFDVPDDC